jgi:hypothetical protein
MMLYNKRNTSRSKIYSPNEISQTYRDGRGIPRRDALVSYLDPNQSSGTTAVDISGKGYNGTLSGGAFISDQNGYSGKVFSFYGGSSRIILDVNSSSLFPNDNGSMFAWVKFKTVSQRQTIFSGYDGGSTERWDFELSETNALSGIHHQTGFASSDPLTGKVEEGKWVFVGFTCNGGDWVHFYCNDERVATAAGNTGLNNSQSVGINLRTASNNEFPADKDFGEIWTFKSELSPEEVKELYEFSRDRYVGRQREIPTDGLIVHLDAGVASSFNTGQTVWNDLSGNGNDATLVNTSYGEGGGAYVNFNGSNGYAQIPYDSNTMNWSNGLTVVCVVMPNEITHVRPFINQQASPGGNGTSTAWRLLSANAISAVDFQWNPTFSDNNGIGINYNQGFDTGKIYFSAAGSDGYGNNFLQINSRHKTDITFGTNSPVGIKQGTGDIFIGINDSYSPDRYLNHRGYIYMVYNRLLTESEVSELYLYFRNRYNLPHHYRDA